MEGLRGHQFALDRCAGSFDLGVDPDLAPLARLKARGVPLGQDPRVGVLPQVIELRRVGAALLEEIL